MTKFSDENIWNILKNIKLGISLGKACYKGLYSHMSDHKLIIEMVERDLEIYYPNTIIFGESGIESTPITFQNMTREKLKTAGEMYFYLLSCPDSLMPWFLFYAELFMKKPPTDIVLTLNRILKGETVPFNKGAKEVAEKLFDFIATNSSFKYQEIKRMMQLSHETENSSFSTLKLKGNLSLMSLQHN